MVNLSSNNSNNINLSGQTQRNVNISTPNTNNVDANTMGNSQRARSWAIGAGLIDGEDYSAKHYAQLAEEIEEDIAADTNNAYIWAEGTDEEVEALGGEHSSKGWVDYVLTNPPTASVEQTDTGATITITDINGTTTADITNGADGANGQDGADGSDGFSPIATVTKSGSTATISITDANGTTTTTITDGQDGSDGFSPIATVSKSGDTATISITDVNGTTTTTITDGTNGQNGQDGAAATITVGTITTGSAGSSASVTNSGTSSAAVFDFTIPRGDKGETGSTGATGNGISTISKTSTSGLIDTYTITYTNSDTDTFTVTNGQNGTNGVDGQDGFSPVATVVQTSGGATITITDSIGTTTANITNGVNGTNGTNGTDGFSPIATVSKSGTTATITITDKNGTTTANVYDGEGGVSDVKVNGTSVLTAGVANIDLTNYVTTDTAQNISGRKTFLGEKAIYFKQNATSDKLGFTLYNPSSTELGALEWRPNTIGSNALLALNCPQSGSNYVGFRYWGNINIIAPRPTTNGNYYIPVNVTDGTNTVTANNNGTLNISTLLPDVSNFVTNSSLATTLADYTLASSLSTVATTGDYDDLTNKPTIPDISSLANKDLSNLSSTGNSKFQTPLVSGTNIKTINNTSLLGSGDISAADNTLSNVSSIDSNSAVQTALGGKADTLLSNLSATGKTVIDGQWTVVNAYCVQDGTSLKGSSELDFTLSVPNDGNLYEVLLSGSCTTGSTSGNYCALMIRSDWFGGDYVYIAQAQTRTSHSLAAMGNVILPLTTSRKIYVYRNSNYNGTCKVKLIGYRRIGSNS